MNRAKWSRKASLQLEAYLDYLAAKDTGRAREARREIRELADATARRPGLARPSRWEGLFERSARRWKKLLVLDRQGDTINVAAFYDMRQDLSAVDPLSE